MDVTVTISEEQHAALLHDFKDEAAIAAWLQLKVGEKADACLNRILTEALKEITEPGAELVGGVLPITGRLDLLRAIHDHPRYVRYREDRLSRLTMTHQAGTKNGSDS